MRESEKETRFLRDEDATSFKLPKAVSYDDLVATGDWVEMYGESNLVSKENADIIMVLHQGTWIAVDLTNLP